MDPRQLAIKGELMTYLPYATDETLNKAASEWVAMVGRNTSVDDASDGLRADFIRRYDDHDRGHAASMR